ncbi:unnamed protein product, partial [Polarella glacialis]
MVLGVEANAPWDRGAKPWPPELSAFVAYLAALEASRAGGGNNADEGEAQVPATEASPADARKGEDASDPSSPSWEPQAYSPRGTPELRNEAELSPSRLFDFVRSSAEAMTTSAQASAAASFRLADLEEEVAGLRSQLEDGLKDIAELREAAKDAAAPRLPCSPAQMSPRVSSEPSASSPTSPSGDASPDGGPKLRDM